MSVRRLDKRPRNACLVCRKHRRKFDGEKPCRTCQRFHDEYTYIPRCRPNSPRAPSKQAPGRIAGNGSNGCIENSASNRDQLQKLEANNPAVFQAAGPSFGCSCGFLTTLVLPCLDFGVGVRHLTMS